MKLLFFVMSLLVGFPVGASPKFSHPIVESTTLSITGRITLGPCIVDNATANQTVNLGTAFLNNELVANKGSDWKEFHLDLKSCPIGLSSATLTLTGNAAEHGPAFANDGSAKGIVLQLSNSDHSVLYGNGDVLTQSIDANRNVQFQLAARMFNPGVDSASKGDFSAVVQVDFTYQ